MGASLGFAICLILLASILPPQSQGYAGLAAVAVAALAATLILWLRSAQTDVWRTVGAYLAAPVAMVPLAPLIVVLSFGVYAFGIPSTARVLATVAAVVGVAGVLVAARAADLSARRLWLAGALSCSGMLAFALPSSPFVVAGSVVDPMASGVTLSLGVVMAAVAAIAIGFWAALAYPLPNRRIEDAAGLT